MELKFKNEKGLHEAEFEATSDFNLHIERKNYGRIEIYQKTSSETNYASTPSYGVNAADIVNLDFSMAVYPKYIKVVSYSEPVQGIITMQENQSGDSSSGDSSSGGYKVLEGMKFSYGEVEYIELPAIDTSECTNLSGFANNLVTCKKITELDFSSCYQCGEITASNVEYMLIKNLGKAKIADGFDFRSSNSWGKNSEENRKSLVDSLLTYSFDRKSAGYHDIFVWLSQDVFDLLTSEELQQIQAKGINVSVRSDVIEG